MARQKKLLTYIFEDGEIEIASSYKAKCNITGEIIPIYHKFLEKLVQTKYKNNFSFFLSNFAKKGAIKQQKIDNGYAIDDIYSLNTYSDYLVICYKGCLRTLEDNFNLALINKTKNEMNHIDECFTRRFNRDIKQFV